MCRCAVSGSVISISFVASLFQLLVGQILSSKHHQQPTLNENDELSSRRNASHNKGNKKVRPAGHQSSAHELEFHCFSNSLLNLTPN
jgi:hypothetical protein